MNHIVSKSQFKAQVLEYLRDVEKHKQPLLITHAGRAVVKVIPYVEDEQNALKRLRNTIVQFKKPTEPVDEKTWETLS